MLRMANVAAAKSLTIEVAPNGDLVQKVQSTRKATPPKTTVVAAATFAGIAPEERAKSLVEMAQARGFAMVDPVLRPAYRVRVILPVPEDLTRLHHCIKAQGRKLFDDGLIEGLGLHLSQRSTRTSLLGGLPTPLVGFDPGFDGGLCIAVCLGPVEMTAPDGQSVEVIPLVEQRMLHWPLEWRDCLYALGVFKRPFEAHRVSGIAVRTASF